MLTQHNTQCVALPTHVAEPVYCLRFGQLMHTSQTSPHADAMCRQTELHTPASQS